MKKLEQSIHCRLPRRALTLLELVVVMAILISLASILVPVLSSTQETANDSSMATNLTEMDKMIQVYAAANGGKFPNEYDSLVDASGALWSGLPAKSSSAAVGGYLTPKALSQWHVDRLSRAGITKVWNMGDPTSFRGAQNKTYMSATIEQPLATSTTLAFVASSGTNSAYSLAGNKMQFETGHEYVVLGIGTNCTMVGPGGLMKDCPVVRHREGCTSPADAYSRVCAIFDMGTTYISGRENGVARFVGCVALADSYFRFSEELTSIR